MKACNEVIAGDYKGYFVTYFKRSKILAISEPVWTNPKWAGLKKNM